jgi:hypothetical protein
MKLQDEHTLQLIDAQQHTLGRIAVERADQGLVTGEFIRDPGFSTIEQLFLDYEEAVNLQALTVVDRLDAQIVSLGLRAVLPEGRQVPLQDVQIWSDGAITFRSLGQDQSVLEAHVMACQTKH